MKKICTLLLILTITLSCSNSTEPDGNGGLISDRPEATNFTLTTVNNETLSLSDFQGKVVYLFFLGYSCPLCKANAPGTIAIDNKYDDSEVQIIGLDVWDGSGSQVLDFIGSTGVNYPILKNASALQSEYNVSYDYSVLVDKQGRVAYKKEGVKSSEISSNIDALLEEE
ncbi:MAG: TlpA family protein disulfide reductase [Calditrichaeota bacterium]|nr:MAG: TlpA family protein disulfide reductase [Calditrichota bacterium]MBL1205363.1 TlpA family protein disulfide reductase [Calditrichota bacterium]NOG45192.1 TlpA family protein disulfide reductase [Calditrichota bacterium]